MAILWQFFRRLVVVSWFTKKSSTTQYMEAFASADWFWIS